MRWRSFSGASVNTAPSHQLPLQIITFTLLKSFFFFRVLVSKLFPSCSKRTTYTFKVLKFYSSKKLQGSIQSLNFQSVCFSSYIFVHHIGKTIIPITPASDLTPSLLLALCAIISLSALINLSPSLLGLLVGTSCWIMSLSRSSRTQRLLSFYPSGFVLHAEGVWWPHFLYFIAFFSPRPSHLTYRREPAGCDLLTSYHWSDECQKCSSLMNGITCCFCSLTDGGVNPMPSHASAEEVNSLLCVWTWCVREAIVQHSQVIAKGFCWTSSRKNSDAGGTATCTAKHTHVDTHCLPWLCYITGLPVVLQLIGRHYQTLATPLSPPAFYLVSFPSVFQTHWGCLCVCFSLCVCVYYQRCHLPLHSQSSSSSQI